MFIYCLQLLVKFRQIISLDSLGSEFHLKAPPAPTLPCVACASAYANYADYANYICKVSPGFSWFLLVSPVSMVFTPLRVGWPPTPQVYFGP